MTSDDENITPAPEPDPVAPESEAQTEVLATAAPAAAARGKVGWKRFAAVLVPSTAVAAGLVMLTASGVLAASFSISGIAFTVTSSHLHGDGFEQYGSLDATANGSDGGAVLVMTSVIGNATLDGLCQQVNLGPVSLILRAGSKTNQVKATNLVVGSTTLSGDATFNTIEIGRDASTLTDVPGNTGPLGDFAQQAKTVDIDNLRQTNYDTSAGSFSLPGLSMGFSTNPKDDC